MRLLFLISVLACLSPRVQCQESSSVLIGDYYWMTNNLDVTTFRNGENIPQAISDEEWIMAGKNKQPAWCYYKNDAKYGEMYGKLYNYYAVNDPRGLAPDGWHIPSVDEWINLRNSLSTGREKRVGDGIGYKMRSRGDWSQIRGNNQSGFTALPTYSRIDRAYPYNYEDVSYTEYKKSAWWWCLSQDLGNESAHYCYLTKDGGLYFWIEDKSGGLSVRCIKNWK